MKKALNYIDFLCDDLFIYWRIYHTKELDTFWMNFIAENIELREPFQEAIEAFKTVRGEQGAIQDNEISALHELKERIKKEKNKKIRKITASSAAALLLLTILSALYILGRKPGNDESGMSSIGVVMHNDNIQLFTGNSILEIDNNSTLNLSEKKQSAVITNRHLQKEIDLIDNTLNRLIVPYGKRSTLILSDGSRVHLNSGTKMEFPSVFSGKKREISVEGEIFIEAAKQNNAPFVVRTLHSEITVRGTSFNVSSYAGEMSESVVLVSGSLEVKSQNSAVLLQPDEMAEIENGLIQRKQVDVSDYTGWTNGYMQLTKTPLNEVLKKIGRYYNVVFRYYPDLDLHGQTCSGKLFLSDNLSDVLEAFSKMTYLRYDKRNDTTIFIFQ